MPQLRQHCLSQTVGTDTSDMVAKQQMAEWYCAVRLFYAHLMITLI